MKLPYFHVDAFTGPGALGNPAGVCPLLHPLPAATMQRIAAENNLAETAFLVKRRGGYAIRWFTPEVEIDLCGHATLASAHVLLRERKIGTGRVVFFSKSGPLRVAGRGPLLELDFPARPPKPCRAPAGLLRALGARPREVLAARDFLAVYRTEAEVRALRPDFALLATLPRPAIVTAPGRGCDFVSRFFAPGMGIAEDPVTGSSHCTLIPYWAARLGKTKLMARQVSRRGGVLECELRGERVSMAGRATTYLRGEILI